MSLPVSNGAILSDAFIEFGATLASFEIDMQVTAQGFLPASFDWNGQNGIPCTASKAEHGAELDVGGWEVRRKVKIQVNISALPDPEDLPKYNDTFVLRLSEDGPETQYRIIKTENSGDATLTIEGTDPNHPAP
jgi:hypothetical protein